MLTVNFCDVVEIRMGSPFNSCRVLLKGDWIPQIELDDYQDKYAESPDKALLSLVKWDINGQNNPGFRLVIIDTQKKHVITSPRIPGCCQSLEWDKEGFCWTTFKGISGIVSVNSLSQK